MELIVEVEAPNGASARERAIRQAEAAGHYVVRVIDTVGFRGLPSALDPETEWGWTVTLQTDGGIPESELRAMHGDR